MGIGRHTNPPRLAALRSAIDAQRHRLYGDRDVIAALEAFLTESVAARNHDSDRIENSMESGPDPGGGPNPRGLS